MNLEIILSLRGNSIMFKVNSFKLPLALEKVEAVAINP